MEAILEEWEAFAKTLYPATAGMSPSALRDHAQPILNAVVTDLSTEQTPDEQEEKSKGRAPTHWNAPETAAQTHAVLRAQSGMNMNQLAAEYRALRASVLRLWEEQCHPGAGSLQDVIRFNEAIDQALAESIDFFNAQVDRSRDLVLGMLGHDMRNPLNAIVMTAEVLATHESEEVTDAAGVLRRSGASMKVLLDDLMDFNRTQLGIGIQIDVQQTDLGKLFADEVGQHQAVHPGRRLELTLHGDLSGRWDGERLQQVLRNLISNAVAYGTPGEPVHVGVHGDGDGVRIDVANRGRVIDPATAECLFDPLKRGASRDTDANQPGLGLGLYIVREITRAHGGKVVLHSNTERTVISVNLPRIAAPTPAIPAS